MDRVGKAFDYNLVNHRMSDHQKFDPDGMNAAMLGVPLGTKVQVQSTLFASRAWPAPARRSRRAARRGPRARRRGSDGQPAPRMRPGCRERHRPLRNDLSPWLDAARLRRDLRASLAIPPASTTGIRTWGYGLLGPLAGAAAGEASEDWSVARCCRPPEWTRRRPTTPPRELKSCGNREGHRCRLPSDPIGK